MGMTLREFVTEWGFSVKDKPLDNVEKKLARIRAQADKTGDAAVSAFDRPRDAAGKFTKYKDSIFGGGKNIFGGWAESINMIGDAANGARNMIAKMMTGFAVGGVGVGGFFKVIGDFEQTEIAFETMIGNTEKAHKTLADLQQFAKNTPFNFAGTADLSKRLLAFSFQAEELIPTMTALGNIAAGVGKDKLPQLVLALGQVKAAGKLRGSELRQFTEAGVPLIAELAKTLNIAESEVQNMVESGTVGYDKVWQSLQKVTGEGGRFHNLMARQSKSLLGIFSNIVDTLQLMAISIGKKGLLKEAKGFMSGILRTLETNREKIIDGAHAAIELTILGMKKLIEIGQGAWHVFQGLAQSVGGTRKAIELMIKGLALFTTGRLIFLLGQAAIGVIGLGKAWLFAGNAARMAKLQMLAIPLAIGAAVIAMALIIEDVVAYFQGRESVTGLLLKDVDKLGDNIEKFLAPVFDKIKVFASKIGRQIMEGIFALSEADWSKFGDILMKALEVILIASTIPLRLGLAIAEGIITGLTTGIKARFPKLADFLGFNEAEKARASMPKPGDPKAFAPQLGILDGGWELIKLLGNVAASDPRIVKPQGILGSPAVQGPGNASVMIEMPVTVTVPPGTPPGEVAPAVEAGVKQGMDGLVREIQRSTKQVIAH